MKHPSRLALAALVLVGVIACGPPVDPQPTGEKWTWNLPKGFPTPRVPADNPMSEVKVELGRFLFYDVRLSGNRTQSCGSCHLQSLAFTDGRAQAVGSTGEVHRRSSMGLTNIAYVSALTWASSVIGTLEHQALLPLFGEDPVELGMMGREAELLERMREDPRYPELFKKAFPDEAEPISVSSIVKAIGAFQRTLISGNSPHDRWLYGGEADAVTDSVKRGRELFFSERLECFHCHGGFNFSDATLHDGTVQVEMQFHNNGLYNLDGNGAYPPVDPGLIEVTDRPGDMGRFRAPTLRNIAVTAPYMHDGSIATLDEVLDHYARGGREITEGPNKGPGWMSPIKSEFLHGFSLTPHERADVLAFLESLTDEQFLTDPEFSDPFAQ